MSRRNGFTLIELLVVIAILTILAALLFPVFARVREKGRQAVCLSNEKQIAYGVLMYMQDYDETFPFVLDVSANLLFGAGANIGDKGKVALPGVTGQEPQFQLVTVLAPYVRNASLWYCPSVGPDYVWEAEVKAARGAVSVARLNLDRSQVRAPFDGAIAQRIVGRGDFVRVGSPLFNVVNDSVLKFIFQVPERYGSYVQKKLPVTFSVDNYPGETFSGSVYLISPSVSQSSRAFGVGALVTNTDFRLKANTFARGSLVLERAVPTPVVPLDSVVSFAGVTKVFVVELNCARSRSVSLGRIRDGVKEVVEGLRAGEAVVLSGQSRLSDGAPVLVQSAEAPKPGLRPALARETAEGQ